MIAILTAILAIIPPPVEITAWAILRGVTPVEALAIHDTESGDVPEPTTGDTWRGYNRDNVVSSGNIGRFQVNRPTWRRLTGQTSCEPLYNRHVNILAGVTIAARWRARCGGPSPHRLCRRPNGVHWTCHYNEGYHCTGHGVRYAGKVAQKIERGRHK